MRTTAIILIVVGLLFLCATIVGMVGFHYPSIVQDEPLQHPQKVARVEGTNLIMESGAIIALDLLWADSISNKLQQSAFQIDVEGTNGLPVEIWARQNGWICGTPWAQPIRIPLFRDKVYKNRRQLIAVGAYIDKKPIR